MEDEITSEITPKVHYVLVKDSFELIAALTKDLADRIAMRRKCTMKKCSCDKYWIHYGRKEV